MDLSTELCRRCRDALRQCYEFSDDQILGAVFITPELGQFRDELPQTKTPKARVDLVGLPRIAG